MQVALDAGRGIIAGMAEALYSISAVATSSGSIPHEKVFYLPPEQHVLEILLCNIIFGLVLFVTFRRGKRAEAAASGSIKEQPRVKRPDDDIQVLSFTAKVMRTILTVCFFVTVLHKYNGNKLALMLMPCHSVTLCYLASMYAKRHSTGQLIFNIGVHYMFFTWLALLLPDVRGLNQFGEVYNFWIHHWILFIIPIYLIFSYHYEIDHVDHYNFKLAAGFGALLHFDIMSIAALVSGHNVGYMLMPPPKTVFTGTFFRWGHATFLIVMGWFSGYVIPHLIIRLREALNYVFNKTKKH